MPRVVLAEGIHQFLEHIIVIFVSIWLNRKDWPGRKGITSSRQSLIGCPFPKGRVPSQLLRSSKDCVDAALENCPVTSVSRFNDSDVPG